MAKDKNLKNDIQTCIMKSFKEDIDKHSVKANHEGFGLVYSYAQRGNLLDLAKNMATWIKENRGVNRLSQLSNDDIKAFLTAKSKECSQNTIERYRSELKKIGECIEARRGIKIDFRVEGVEGQKGKETARGASDVISKGDLRRIVDYCTQHPSKSSVAVLIGSVTGLRVSDIGRGIKISLDGKIEATGKGGRAYRGKTIDIQTLNLLTSDKFEKFLDKTEDGKLSYKSKDNSVNKYLQRVEAKLGLAEHSFHSIRRRCAQDHYNGCIDRGMSKKEALASTSEYLNHNGDRRDVEAFLTRHYIET